MVKVVVLVNDFRIRWVFDDEGECVDESVCGLFEIAWMRQLLYSLTRIDLRLRAL